MSGKAVQSIFCLLLTAVCNTSLQAEVESPIIAVEEDWVVEILEPDSNTGSPQFATQIKPNKSSESVYALFCVNYQEVPDFIEGGLEIQLWNQEWVVDVDGKAGFQLSLNNEKITWTQVLKLENAKLVFKVKDGNSTTYGSFGGDTFSVSQPLSIESLINYDPAASIADSAVTLGANRVKNMYLKEVRYTRADGSVEKDTQLRYVVQASSEDD